MRSFVIRRRNVLTALALAALCAAALVPALATGQTTTACADLLAYYKAAAVAPLIVDDDFFEGGFLEEAEEEAAFEGDAMMGDESPASGNVVGAAGGPADLGARSEAGTNVQVAGVDESDIVKTNGSEIFVLRDDTLVIVSVSEDPPRVIGGLRFGSARSAEGPREMLLAGDRLLIFRSVLYGRMAGQPGIQLVEVDVRAPARPRVLRTLYAYGNFVTARLVGTAVRVVLTHDGADGLNARWLEQIGSDDEYGYDPYSRADDRTWRDLVERSSLSTWLPIYAVEDRTSGRWGWGRLASCDSIQTPPIEQAPQRGTLTTLLLNFDLTDGIGASDAAGVIGATDAVYASTNAVYVAMRDWNTWSSADTTIHRWDLSDGAAIYDGAALVTGELINQFAMSEHRGRLRVATTNWEWPVTQSLLTVFEIGEDGLEQVGQLDGLGPTESIYAVRFLGDQAYVVTFRQIDPLYVIDLSDPDNPVLAGELKIPGFSSYLHPLGGGLLLGVGQNADPRTGQPLGLQVSLFDVSDPAEPTRLDQVDLSEGSRSTTFEHRAFTYHRGRAYIPASPTNDLFAVRVAQDGLELEQRITAQGPVLRSLPIGDRLHLLLEGSLATHDLATLDLLSGVYLVPPSGR